MTISYVDSSEYQSGPTTEVDLPLSLPSGWAEGDVALVSVMRDMAIGSWSTASPGWNLIANRGDTVGRRRYTALFYKVLTATESDPTFTYSSATEQEMSGIMTVYRGNFSTGNVINVYANDEEENVQTPTCPPVTTTEDNCALVLFHMMTLDDITGPTAPTGYTVAESIYSILRPNRQMVVAYKLDVGASGLKTPTAWLHETSGTVAADSTIWTVALAEDPSGSTYNEDVSLSLESAISTVNSFNSSVGVDIALESSLYADSAGVFNSFVSYGHIGGFGLVNNRVVYDVVALPCAVQMAFEPTLYVYMGLEIEAYGGLQAGNSSIFQKVISLEAKSYLDAVLAGNIEETIFFGSNASLSGVYYGSSNVGISLSSTPEIDGDKSGVGNVEINFGAGGSIVPVPSGWVRAWPIEEGDWTMESGVDQSWTEESPITNSWEEED